MNNSKNHLTKTRCPRCKKEVPMTPFCLFCGQVLVIEPLEEGEKKLNSMIICPHCNQNVPKTKYCIKCGQEINDFSLTHDKQAIISTKSHETVLCPLCRQSVLDSHNFCHLCGAKLKKEKESYEESLVCNRCWKANPPEHTGSFCIYCGAVALGKRTHKSKLLEEPFEGYQLELSQFFQPTTVSISTIKQSMASKNFPIKSTISYSSYFGLKTQEPKTNVFSRNFGVFDKNNLLNYLGVFILTLLIYGLWFYSRYIEFSGDVNPFVIGILILGMSGLLTSLLMFPIWLSSFLVYKKSGHKLNFRLDHIKASITIIFNLMWLSLPFLFLFGFGPIILHMGEIRDVKPQIFNQRSFRRGIILGVIFVLCCSTILGLLTLTIVGMPGLFSGFLFQDHPLTGHILASYFGATWLSIILLLPLGDYYDKVIKQWNIVGYLILLIASFILLTHSLNLIGILTQENILL